MSADISFLYAGPSAGELLQRIVDTYFANLRDSVPSLLVADLSPHIRDAMDAGFVPTTDVAPAMRRHTPELRA